jgi:hypothetical protein
LDDIASLFNPLRVKKNNDHSDEEGEEEERTPSVNMTRSFLVLLLLVAAASAAPEFRVELKRSAQGRIGAAVRMGFPTREVIVPVRFTTPASLGRFLDTASATKVDLPSQYAALWVESASVLGYSVAMQHAASPLQTPTIKLTSRGGATWMPSNATASRYEAGLYLGPGSAAFSRWRYVFMSENELRLTDTIPAMDAPSFRCDQLDEHHRCVMLLPEIYSLHNGHGPQALTRITRLVLDWEQSYGQLPKWLYARVALSKTSLDNALLGVKWQGQLIVRDADDIRDPVAAAATPEDPASPFYQVGTRDNTIILGRKVLARLLTTAVYDSSAESWSFVFSTEFAAAWDYILMLIPVTVQAFLVGSHVMGRNTMAFKDLFYARASQTRDYEQVPWPHVLVMVLLGVFQLITGTVLVGNGPGVDVELGKQLKIVGIVACSVAAWLLIAGVAAFYALQRLIADPPRNHCRAALWIFFHGCYIKIASLGILGSLLPYAAQSRGPLLFAAFELFGYILSSLAYAALGLLMVGVGRWRDKTWTHRLVWVAAAASFAALAVLTWASILYVFAPLYYSTNSNYDNTIVLGAATITGLLPSFAVALLLFVQLEQGGGRVSD